MQLRKLWTPRRINYIILLAIPFALAGCGNSEKQITPKEENKSVETSFFAMDTVMSITAYGSEDEKILEAAKTSIEDLEKLVSVTDEDSEIWRVNHHENEEITISQNTKYLMNNALEISKRTNGAFDISMYPILKEWGFTTGQYQIPTEETIKNLLSYVDYTKIILGENDSVKIGTGMEVDLGAIAKGYAGDLAVNALKEAGVTSAILNLGGNVQTLGSKPDGSKWTIGIKDPLDTDAYLGTVKIENKAVITSGGYERYFVGEDGETYWHILNPATGNPAKNGLISATIIGEQGIYCDALSTAMFVLGEEKAVEYWRNYSDFEMILVDEKGNILITEGIANEFNSDYEVTVIAKEQKNE